jgi:hypothetical protein
MMKIQLSALLFFVSLWSFTEAFADAPKPLEKDLKPDHVVESVREAYRVMNDNRFRYIATHVVTLEWHAWQIRPFSCPIAELRQAVRIDVQLAQPLEYVRTQDYIKIHEKILAHNVALSKWQGRSPPCTKKNLNDD